MCGRFTIAEWDELLAVARHVQMQAPFNPEPEWPARYPEFTTDLPLQGSAATDAIPGGESPAPHLGNAIAGFRQREATDAFPGSETGVLVADPQGQIVPRLLRWGFPRQDGVAFNTRSETASTSPFWRESFLQRRCVIVAWRFFEPHGSQQALGPSGRIVKQQYAFQLPFLAPLLMAGIWRDDRFSILTREPNQVVRPIHDRMPVLLDVPEAHHWLLGANADTASTNAGNEVPLVASPLYPPAPQQLRFEW